MIAYVINVLLLFFWAALLLWHKPDDMKKRVFCILASSQWILLSGLRHISVGADTQAYKWYSFDLLLSKPWDRVFSEMWSNFSGQFVLKDPGYSVFVKSLQLVSHDYQLYLVLVALIFTVPLGIFIYRRSSDPLMSFLIYSLLFSSFFAITGIRQTIATALVVLVGYKFIEQRRLLPFLLLCAVAFTIHKSVICFVPFYFVATSKLTWTRVLALFAAVPVVYVFRLELMAFFGNLLGYEQFTQQFVGAGAWVFGAVLTLVVVVAVWRAPMVLRDEPRTAAWYNAVLVALVLTPLTFVDPSAMRVVQYYSLFLMLLVPAVLRSFHDKNERALAYLVAVSSLAFLFFRTDPQYLFFWQGIQ